VSPELLAVFAAGSLAVLASACGALPLAFRRTVDNASLGSGTAIAAGVMLAVGGGLLLGSPDETGLLVAGVAVGIVSYRYSVPRLLAVATSTSPIWRGLTGTGLC